MSVLVGIPYHPRKRYSLEYVFDWIDNQTYKDVEIVLRVHLGTFGEPGAVKTQREFFRQIAVEKQHDYFYSFGADTIPPLDVLEQLLAHQKDVVGAIYHQRKDGETTPIIAWREGDEAQAFGQESGLITIDGMGMDAVLFSRKAFTSFSWKDWGYSDDDFPVYDRLKAQGFDIWLDTDIRCKHYMTKEKYV